MGNAPEPDTKRYWNRDLYTHIKWGRVSDPEADEDGWMDGRKHDLMRRDSLVIGKSILALDSISAVTWSQSLAFGLLDKDLAVAAHFRLTGGGPDTNFTALYIVRDSLLIPDMVTLDTAGSRSGSTDSDPAEATFETVVWENLSIRRDFIVMQAIVFPQINLLWLGCLIMTAGALMAVRQPAPHRTDQNRQRRMIQRAHVIGMGRLGRISQRGWRPSGSKWTRWNWTLRSRSPSIVRLRGRKAGRCAVRHLRRRAACMAAALLPALPDDTWLIHHAGSVPTSVLGDRPIAPFSGHR